MLNTQTSTTDRPTAGTDLTTPAELSEGIRTCADSMRHLGRPSPAISFLNDLAISLAKIAVKKGYVTPDQWQTKQKQLEVLTKTDGLSRPDGGVNYLADHLDYVADLIAGAQANLN